METLTIGSQQSTRQKHALWLHEIITPRAMPIVKTSPSGSSSSSSDYCHSSTLVVPIVVLLQPLPTLLSISFPISPSSRTPSSALVCHLLLLLSHLPSLGEPSVGLAPQPIRTLAAGNRLHSHCSSAFCGTPTTRGTCRSGPSTLRLCTVIHLLFGSLPLHLSHLLYP